MKPRIAEWKDGTTSGALFSDDERHRLLLYRVEPNAPGTRPRFPMFLMLNPSTATHEVSDPTVTRCAGFTRRLGYRSFHVCNLFSFRATDPVLLRDEPNAEGDPANLDVIFQSASAADIVICAWGVHGELRNRGLNVLKMLTNAGLDSKLRTFGTTFGGHPKHPLYLAGDVPLRDFVTGSVVA